MRGVPKTPPVLRIILGPTAAGKSGIAMALARERPLAIVSADSRQIYQQFDIGTAKPTAGDRAAVPHYGIDIISPLERYSAHAWAAGALAWCADASAMGLTPVVVGGTGFYVRALTSPLDQVPLLDSAAREQLGAWLDGLDAATLSRWSSVLDPARSTLGRTQQLRAVETALLTGRRLSDALGKGGSPRRAARYLVVDPGAVLGSRISDRVGRMLDAGWMNEVAELAAVVAPDAPAWKASGYQTMRACLHGQLSLRDATERVVIETRQYAKRQRTWCRHQLFDGPVSHLNPDRADALERALAWWDGSDLETE
ncbi:MAG TPA: tRNA (adenosine(37)-N6)-dimethylallyltransferase MiaA [Gemmatimonas sp.]|nr:tRNA (adenosine(37)-N6)-dimethylallyltransferase MiaA [Gemmatimonas sp.]